MIEILAYALGIMYSPGPVNLLSLNSGLNGQFRSSLGFFVGVGFALLLLFLVFGYGGVWLLDDQNRRIISLVGSLYIAYLAYRVARSNVEVDNSASQAAQLRFRDGLLMQLLNPKGIIATVPIATVQFPAANITGMKILIWSLLLSVLAIGAPGSYSLMGLKLSHWVSKPIYFKVINLSMSALLQFVAVDIAYDALHL